MRHYLTPAFVKGAQCPAGKPFEIYWDGDGKKAVTGLGWKVMASGAGSYVCQYHHNGRDARMALDKVVSLKDARKWARGILGDAAKDHDPAAARRKARAAAKTAVASTVKTIAELYLKIENAKLRPNTLRQRGAIIRNVIIPRLGPRQSIKSAAATLSGSAMRLRPRPGLQPETKPLPLLANCCAGTQPAPTTTCRRLFAG